jgi:hypothetical protein
MVNHTKEFLPRNTSVQSDGVPESFVHMVARLDSRAPLAEFDSKLRVAFQVDRRWVIGEIAEQKDFALKFEHQHIWAEWQTFSGFILQQTILADRVDVHGRESP